MQASAPVAAPVVVSTIQTPQRKEHYMSKCVLGLSITQIAIGTLCILLQVVLIEIKSPSHFLGQGIWTGIFFILAGSFGIRSGNMKTKYAIVTFLIFAIISAILTVGLFMFSLIAIEVDNHQRPMHVPLGINVMLIILAVTQAVVAIVSSAFTCHGLCGGNQNQPMLMTGQVQYIQGPDGQQQMVILPFNQQGAGMAAGPSFNPVQSQLPAYSQTPPPTYEESKLSIPE